MDRNLPDAPRPATTRALLRPLPAAIPAALRAVERWICWRAQPRADGKFDKVPHRPHTGRPCDALDPTNWGSFDQALAALGRYRLDGIGIVLTGEDALAGIDLDGCLGQDGAVAPWAREIVAAIDSYTERSPSGRGLRILAVGALPPGRHATAGLEMYDRARFLTITGHHLAGTPTTIERRDDALQAVHARYFGEEVAPAPVSGPGERAAGRGDPPSLDEVRAMLRCIPQRLTYDAWLHVLMAVHEAYPGPEGVALCEDWSPGDAGEIARKFASFKRHGVGVGTLIHLAKQHGWRPAERPAPATVLPSPAPSCGAQVASHSDGADDALGASPMELTSMEPQVASHSPAGQAAGRRVLGERGALVEPAGVAGSPPLSAHDGAAASGGSAAPHADRTGHQHGMAWAVSGALGAVPGSAPVRGNGGHRHGS